MVIPAENKNLPTNDQRGEKFIKLCYNLVPHAFLGDAKSYVGKDRYRIKVKKYLSFLYPYAFRLVPLILLLYPSNRPVLIGHLAGVARPSIRFSFSLANRVPMDARYLLHSGNRKSLGEQRWNPHSGLFGDSRFRTSVRIEFRNRFLTARTPEAVSLEEDSAPGLRLHGHRP